MKQPSLDSATILITGGTGSWGHELTRQLFRKSNPKEVRIYSRNELRQVEMRRAFHDPRLKFVIGDVRDSSQLCMATRGVDYVFHLAALKHVTVCEDNPWEAVLTNVIGTKNVIDACVENGVKKMIDVSTDKAVDPLNLYGICKACGERLTVAANLLESNTAFVCVRGGNVLGTAGSVIPLFLKQVRELNSITLTDPRMTRFLLPLPDAIGLVFEAFMKSVGGETYVMKMPACFIKDMAEVFVETLGNDETTIRTIGIRPGEKIDEVLVSRHESARVIPMEHYFLILPVIHLPKLSERYKKSPVTDVGEYSSRNTTILNKRQIKTLLDANGFLGNETPPDDLIDSLDKRSLKAIAQREKWVI